MNSRKCEVCNVHWASYAKHLRIKYHLKNEKQNGMIIPEPTDFKNLLKIKLRKYITVNH